MIERENDNNSKMLVLVITKLSILFGCLLCAIVLYFSYIIEKSILFIEVI
jgi:hypothetical protein